MDEAEWPLVTGEDLLQDLAALPRELQGPAPTGDDDLAAFAPDLEPLRRALEDAPAPAGADAPLVTKATTI